MAKITNRELEEQYESGEIRLNQERNDFLLPQIMDFVHSKRWINLHPEYQRRLVWDNKKRSLFIESLLMNLPVPPVFLFEVDYSRYEVIDGQQRLSAVCDFYENRLRLNGLEKWPGLNGKNYSDLPPMIQRGIDRRRISAVVLLVENFTGEQKKHDIRRLMFERLNTGGQNLNPQELRNCLYAGPFNDMILHLAAHPLFNDIWEIPRYQDHIRGGHISASLAGNSLFKRMTDCEIVLRFFAFRKRSTIKGGVRTILDRCMEQNVEIHDDEIAMLESDFISRLELAYELFGDLTFRLPGEGKGKLSQPLYDAVMLGLDRHYSNREILIQNRQPILRKMYQALENEEFYALITAKANTADAIKSRLTAVETQLGGFL